MRSLRTPGIPRSQSRPAAEIPPPRTHLSPCPLPYSAPCRSIASFMEATGGSKGEGEDGRLLNATRCRVEPAERGRTDGSAGRSETTEGEALRDAFSTRWGERRDFYILTTCQDVGANARPWTDWPVRRAAGCGAQRPLK